LAYTVVFSLFVLGTGITDTMTFTLSLSTLVCQSGRASRVEDKKQKNNSINKARKKRKKMKKKKIK
jgi:hypothetical protein